MDFGPKDHLFLGPLGYVEPWERVPPTRAPLTDNSDEKLCPVYDPYRGVFVFPLLIVLQYAHKAPFFVSYKPLFCGTPASQSGRTLLHANSR